MELDYFKMMLRSYLREHGFEPEDLESDIVASNADYANDTFESARRAGYSVDGSVELATQELHTGIGLSPREVFADLLINDFNDRLHVTDQMFLEFWIQKLSDCTSIIQEFSLKDGLGLDPAVLEESRGRLRHRIDQYLRTNGL